APKLSGARELPKRLRDRARVGAENRIDVAAEYFPRAQQDDERADGDNPTRQRAPRLGFGRRLTLRAFDDVNHLAPQRSKTFSGDVNLRRQSLNAIPFEQFPVPPYTTDASAAPRPVHATLSTRDSGCRQSRRCPARCRDRAAAG